MTDSSPSGIPIPGNASGWRGRGCASASLTAWRRRMRGEASVEAKLRELRTRLLEINDLTSAAALLRWDQTTYMPPGGAAARARQLATLGRLAHEQFTDTVIGTLLDELRP